MRQPIYLMSFCLALSAFAGAATADPRSGRDHFIRSFDTDGNGVVTRQEFELGSVEKFSNMDVNGDGMLSADEFSSHMKARRQQWHSQIMESLDGNSDGTVSLDEYLEAKQAKAKRRFEQMDSNGDGRLSSDEFANHHRNHKDGHHKHGQERDRIFSRMDVNQDGMVTMTENATSWQNWFDRLDADGNGEITATELQQVHSNYYNGN